MNLYCILNAGFIEIVTNKYFNVFLKHNTGEPVRIYNTVLLNL